MIIKDFKLFERRIDMKKEMEIFINDISSKLGISQEDSCDIILHSIHDPDIIEHIKYIKVNLGKLKISPKVFDYRDLMFLRDKFENITGINRFLVMLDKWLESKDFLESEQSFYLKLKEEIKTAKDNFGRFYDSGDELLGPIYKDK